MYVDARISDNVLDEQEWTIVRLRFVDGVVADRSVVRSGIYSEDSLPAVGDSVELVALWSAYDGTGGHPENYYELRIKGGWQSFVSANELLAQLEATL